MSITHTRSIANLERNASDGGVTIAHWRCSSTDGPRIASAYGTTSHTPDPTSANFVAYSDLTEEVVLGWVHEQVVQADVEASNEAKVEAIANPTSATGTPW
tara:strand:- start:69 stop:371 length:303 start_codon:yes stop_codon:yes gene_type:complete